MRRALALLRGARTQNMLSGGRSPAAPSDHRLPSTNLPGWLPFQSPECPNSRAPRDGAPYYPGDRQGGMGRCASELPSAGNCHCHPDRVMPILELLMFDAAIASDDK